MFEARAGPSGASFWRKAPGSCFWASSFFLFCCHLSCPHHEAGFCFKGRNALKRHVSGWRRPTEVYSPFGALDLSRPLGLRASNEHCELLHLSLRFGGFPTSPSKLGRRRSVTKCTRVGFRGGFGSHAKCQLWVCQPLTKKRVVTMEELIFHNVRYTGGYLKGDGHVPEVEGDW